MSTDRTLFTDPDPDHARAYFRTKSRRETLCLMSLPEAVATYVHDGDYLVSGGFGAVRAPIAAMHEIVRQGRKNLGFAGHTSTHDIQVLTVGRAYNRVDAAYVVGLEARGLSRAARSWFESGSVRVVEDTNHGLAVRFKAAAMGVPYLPMRSSLGTDTYRFSSSTTVICPFTGMKLAAKPALYADVAFIHVHEADQFGNARFRGIQVSDIDVANSAKRVVITTEHIVPREEMVAHPEAISIPYYLVDAVCHVPGGAYPGTMPYEYFSDEDHLKEWLQLEGDPERYATATADWIFASSDHREYINKCGGAQRMEELRRLEIEDDPDHGVYQIAANGTYRSWEERLRGE